MKRDLVWPNRFKRDERLHIQCAHGRREGEVRPVETWQLASFCPFRWLCVATCAKNSRNSTAKVHANTLVVLRTVFALKLILLLLYPVTIRRFPRATGCNRAPPK